MNLEIAHILWAFFALANSHFNLKKYLLKNYIRQEMEKTQIQFPRYLINKPKHEAIPIMETYVNEHIDEFIDGEEITVRYLGTDGKIRSVNAVVNIPINGDDATVSIEIGESDTIKIIEKDGDEGLDDKDSLWLSDNWDESVDAIIHTGDLREEVRQMAFALRTVREELALCKEALTNTLGGGDIITNSEKTELENLYEPEAPEGAPQIYTTGDTEIYEWDMYIGDAKMSAYSSGGLYAIQRYYPKARAFNSAGEEIEITSAITVDMSCAGGSAIVTIDGKILYAYTTGDTTFTATIHDPEHGFVESHSYLIQFEKNEKPDYPFYNVKHLLVKHAESEEIMFANSKYLLIGEFCWCIKEQSLYLKEKAANGTIQLFKINGGGSVTPTGETETVTYVVTDGGILSATSSDDAINISEDGILTLIGEVTEDGILILNDTETDGGGDGGGGVTPTGGTDGSTARVSSDGTLEITIPGSTSPITTDGVLMLVGQLASDGVISFDS